MARILFAGLIAAVLLVTTPVVAAQTFPVSLASADSLYQIGAFDQAADEYRQIVAQEPKNLSAQRGLVRALLKGEHPDEAAEAAAKAITLAPHDAPLIVLLGDVYFRQARFDASKMHYLTALTADPNSAPAYAGLGRLMLTESNDRQAIHDFSRACSPSHLDISIALSCAHAASETTKRMDFLKQYLAAAPHNDPEAFERAAEGLKIEQFLAGRKTFVCTGPERGSVKLDAIRPAPNVMGGLRVPV